MKKIFLVIIIMVFTLNLLSFSEPVEIDDDLNGELLVNYEKNVQIIDGKLWILYYDVAIHPMTTYLKLAREQEDGSFEVMELCNMNIAAGVRSQLDCTFAVQDEEVTIFYQKTYSNIEDVRVFKLHSNNLMINYNESEFSSLYGNIASMSLELVEDELVLVLLRGGPVTSCGMRSLYFENNNGNEFTGQDQFTGRVYSKDDIIIHQTTQGNNGGWPTFHDLVVSEGRIMDASTGQPAINSAPMDNIFLGGYIENSANININSGVAAEIRMNGYSLDSSIDRDICYVKIDGSNAVCRYADIIVERDTFIVHNSFPDAAHPNTTVGDSIWTNYLDVKTLDWDIGTFNIPLQNSSAFVYCQMWIEGDVSGSMTLGCADTIFITGDLIYNSVIPGEEPLTGYDYLGLVSEKSIVVKYKNYDPDMDEIQSPNCDGVYIYGVMVALGEDGNLGVEYLHPHGSTPAYEIVRNGYREIFPYPDLNKFIFPPSPYWIGDQGFMMHSNAMPEDFPCCGFPYENEDYGNGIITPYGTDIPWYNPAYPESSEDIVFERGTIELYGGLYERDFHQVLCNGDDPEVHYNNIWDPDNGLYGGTHEPCGYELNIYYDERLDYQNICPPAIHLLGGPIEHQVTVLHSTNGGDSFVQRYNQVMNNSMLSMQVDIQTEDDEEILAFIYKAVDEYRVDFWDKDSNGMTLQTLSNDEFTGDIRNIRLFEDELYFQDDTAIYHLLNNNLYPLSDLITGEYYGFSYDYSDRLQWTADWQSYNLIFTFYEGDEYWQFSEIGESVYEYGSEVDIFNLEDIFLNINDQGEAQLFLHGREYNEDMFYLARDLIEALPIQPDEISEVLNMIVYPNPYISGSTRSDCMISYTIPETQSGEIGIYNIKGQFLNKWQVENSGEISIKASDYKSGVYLLRIQSDGGEIERKLSIIK
ncbi:MAG: T9SS type A sorting domain-containing protein [Candidatus Stygibacter australis]|nr:T9SS type A sorting domain-containing protein [Candidatus Stygibacter australis]